MRKNENAWREKAGQKSFPKSLIWLKLLNVYDILTNTISNQLHKIEIEFIKNVNLTGNEKLLPFICRHFDWKFVLLKIFCTKQGNVANIVEFFKCFWCKTKKNSMFVMKIERFFVLWTFLTVVTFLQQQKVKKGCENNGESL